MQLAQGFSLLKKAFNNWNDHDAPRLGASVAFYSLLSFAPLLVLIAAVVALVFTQQKTHDTLVQQANDMMGSRGGDMVKSLLENAQKPSSGVFASVVAFATVLFGASGVFGELRTALNALWDVKPAPDAGWKSIVKDRLFSFGMVLSVGFLLLVSLVVSAALTFVGTYFQQLLPIPEAVLQVVNFLFSFAVITALFALMFKFVPSAPIEWRDVRVGAVGTALLFTLGKVLLGIYLGKASVGSAYGAAGSLVAVIVWVYYSAQIFFFGAAFTRVYSDTHVRSNEANVSGASVSSR